VAAVEHDRRRLTGVAAGEGRKGCLVADQDSVPGKVPENVAELEDVLSQPPARVVRALSTMDGDIVLLGVGGKMGPTMARMARRALQLAGSRAQVIGVSRFRDAAIRERLEGWGIHTVACDLLDPRQVDRLPDAAGVVSMPALKFGASRNPALAWATNCYAPTLICRRYAGHRIVAFSTGNVYGMVAPGTGGSLESDPPRPEGEYSMSALGRERMYEYFSAHEHTPITILRLNYATELRYGVLVDLAQLVASGQSVDVTMGYVNVIWLGDANAMTLCALEQTASPARIINLAGPEIMATRDICHQLAEQMDTSPRYVGTERPDALLSNGQVGHQLLGYPAMSTGEMIRWTARWIARGGPTLGKPTQFQTRTGEF
jgi:nucleoside-diphosphate-sugar epimerase